ncbi:MAG: nucleotidyl transferase AbiEii/AbiGii toxin family protein [Gammaproteobacteria bacterium]|nr:nucleotidyl transferase AbiEii/AbiGii toxin family protein [Gammaproteobacteria bacterium]
MPEVFFKLSRDDQREVLEFAREKTDRPTHLLEKDVWVVWTLGALFDSPLSADLTFKGGTSLSKAYKVIDRFSEDIALTYDIRKLIDDLIGDDSALPSSRSQANKWTKAVRERLPGWIATQVRPVIEAALAREQVDAKLEIGGKDNDKLFLHYPALKQGTGYVPPVVALEFGGRATGEPHQMLPVVCDMDGHVPNVSFPTASPLVMSVARTFWEKATAAHIYCAQGRIRSERYARHWHDLAALGRSQYFAEAVVDRAVATSVVQHKSCFFIEKDSAGSVIDYMPAVSGKLNIVPEGNALAALAEDYTNMLADQVMLGDALSFDRLMRACRDIEIQANRDALP